MPREALIPALESGLIGVVSSRLVPWPVRDSCGSEISARDLVDDISARSQHRSAPTLKI